MKVNTLLKKVGLDKSNIDFRVKGITSNSKDVKNDYIFVCIKGYTVDGYDYIKEAITNGAKLIISDRYYEYSNIIIVNNTKFILAELLKVYYKKYLNKLIFIGVTGTNGKTSTSTLIYKYLEYNNKRSILVGSNGIISRNRNILTNNTTPSILEIYDTIVYAVNNSIKYFILEVSSVSVTEARIKYIPFKIMIFTNFSLDHLDYHKTLDNYFNAKKEVFSSLDKKSYAIVNIDDEKGYEIIKDSKAYVYTYGINYGEYKAINLNTPFLSFNYNNEVYKSNLIGDFNLYNILPLFIITKILKIKSTIRNFLFIYKEIPGRMNKIVVNDITFIVDYAHTPISVKESIKSTLKICESKLFVVIGCGGKRDKSKREIIGNILDEYDIVKILTSDNPRSENPKDIINDITKGISKEYKVITNRKKAINYCFNNASSKDIILVLGKGIEKYIYINNKKIPYSDIEYIKSLGNNS